MDSQIIHKLMTSCLEAAQAMKKKSGYHEKFRHILGMLPGPGIGKDGTILEWAREYEEAEPGHRHISHLFALHPGDRITANGTPELAVAASKTLEKRLAYGSGHTGWSRAWIINLYARLLNGHKAYENLNELLKKSTLPNLLDNHPPFQIDGNFGGTAGIAEMLVQSHAGEIHLLPALPSEWKNGHVRGLRCRGGAGVSITWKDNALEKAGLTALKDCEVLVRYGRRTKRVKLYGGKEVLIDGAFFGE